MKDVIISKLNETFIKLKCSEAIERHLYEHFSFTTPKMKYHPKVKAKLWDGYLHLYRYNNETMYLGLIEELYKFFNHFDYSYEFTFKKEDNYSKELYEETLKLLSSNITLREHQETAIDFAIKNNRGIIVSATASGKSLVIYFLTMYYLLKGLKKILIIVPRVDLVNQLKNQFLEYHNGDKEEFAKEFELIYSGSEKNNNASITISTYQSLLNKSVDFFEKFDILFMDEVHTGKSAETTKIIEKTINAKHKFGFTGTLTNNDEEQEMHELVLKGLFGRIFVATTNKEMIDKGYAPKVIINAIKLNYSNKDVCNNIIKGTSEIQEIRDFNIKRKKLFENEVSYVLQDKLRNKFIANLAISRKGNVLVFFQFVEKHGKILYETIKRLSEGLNKKVYYIDGNISIEERAKIKDIIETSEDVIVILSFGTSSTGLDYKNVHHAILASGFKGSIIIKQTIGRGLRLKEGKNEFNVYDIGDDFSQGKKSTNFLFKHFMERIKLYQDEKFILNVNEFNIKEN